MIRIYILFGLIAILPTLLHAQEWHLVESGVTSNLYDIQFVDNNTGWAVGADSTIIKTTDGGHTWFRQTGGVAGQYRCLFFVDENHGWIGGKDSVLLHTTNGGLSWERQALTAVMDVNSLFFLNPDTGWIAAADGPCGTYFCNGALLKTTNAGETWEETLRTPLILSFDSLALDSIYNGRFHDVVFINDSTGFACGEIFSDRGRNIGCILSTTDAGESWNHIVEWNVWTATYRLGMISQDTIYAATYVGTARTQNGGNTVWESLKPYTSTYDIAYPGSNCVYGIGHYGGEINIRRYCDGETEPIYENLEGGPNHVDIANIDLFMGLFMFDTASGWICGEDGKLWNKPGLVNAVDLPPQIDENAFSIDAIYPNPARSSVTVHFQVPTQTHVRLAVYSVLGERVALLEDGPRAKGRHRIECTMPAHLKAGLYFYELQTPQGTARRSMVLAK